MLREKKTSNTEKNSIIFGRHPVIEAIESGKQVEKLFIQKGISNHFVKKIIPHIHKHDIPVQYVPSPKLKRLTKGNHQGIVAILPLVEYLKTDNVVPMLFEQGKVPLLLILDRISDVRNMGAIARSAECSGADALIIPQKESAQINAEAIKASSGALHKIAVCREPNLENVVTQLKMSGIQIIASGLHTSKFPFEVDFTLPSAIIFGSEGKGISKELLKQADQIVKIPSPGTIESYNVSVAAGILLYEVLKQRRS